MIDAMTLTPISPPASIEEILLSYSSNSTMFWRMFFCTIKGLKVASFYLNLAHGDVLFTNKMITGRIEIGHLKCFDTKGGSCAIDFWTESVVVLNKKRKKDCKFQFYL